MSVKYFGFRCRDISPCVCVCVWLLNYFVAFLIRVESPIPSSQTNNVQGCRCCDICYYGLSLYLFLWYSFWPYRAYKRKRLASWKWHSATSEYQARLVRYEEHSRNANDKIETARHKETPPTSHTFACSLGDTCCCGVTTTFRLTMNESAIEYIRRKLAHRCLWDTPYTKFHANSCSISGHVA